MHVLNVYIRTYVPLLYGSTGVGHARGLFLLPPARTPQHHLGPASGAGLGALPPGVTGGPTRVPARLTGLRARLLAHLVFFFFFFISPSSPSPPPLPLPLLPPLPPLPLLQPDDDEGGGGGGDTPPCGTGAGTCACRRGGVCHRGCRRTRLRCGRGCFSSAVECMHVCMGIYKMHLKMLILFFS